LDHCITVNAQSGKIPKIRVVYPLVGWTKQTGKNMVLLSSDLLGILKRSLFRPKICIVFGLAIILVVLFWKGGFLSKDKGIANWYVSSEGQSFNDTITNPSGNESLLIFLPTTASGSSPIDNCKQILPLQETYTQKCIQSLEREVPWFNLQIREVLTQAKKQPNADKEYAPITGFLNMIVEVDRYTRGPMSRGDPISDIQLEMIRKSGLLEHASIRVRVGLLKSERTSQILIIKTKTVVEDAVERLTCGAKHPVTIEYWNPPQKPSNHECETINLLRNWCALPEHQTSFVFYLHNQKNRGMFDHEIDRNWRDWMMYFLVERWELCANTLSQGIPTCGVDLRMDESGVWPHYGGNFWWARCDFITQIDHVCTDPRFWLLQKQYGKVGSEERAIGRSLWDSNFNNYRRPYPRSEYNCADLITKRESFPFSAVKQAFFPERR